MISFAYECQQLSRFKSKLYWNTLFRFVCSLPNYLSIHPFQRHAVAVHLKLTQLLGQKEK